MNKTERSKSYFFYLVAILSLFQIYRSYTIDGARTTALVWYFFPDVDFEIGLSYLSYIGIISGLGGFLANDIGILDYPSKQGLQDSRNHSLYLSSVDSRKARSS